MEQVVVLGLGFVLTTVAGGWLGAWFQQRTWDHQNEARLREAEQERAGDVCQSVSLLLDRRLYRMLRLYYVIREPAREDDQRSLAVRRLADYDEVLYEWNDNLNVNSALVGTYFGSEARDWLEGRLYRDFQEVGRLLEAQYRLSVGQGGDTIGTADIEDGFVQLNDAVYRLGVFMMTHLREGLVGRRISHAVPRVDSPREVVGRGVPLASIVPTR